MKYRARKLIPEILYKVVLTLQLIARINPVRKIAIETMFKAINCLLIPKIRVLMKKRIYTIAIRQNLN